jgi:ubiquinone/menaquinone biosynthesis C-methylase UbiE
MVEKNRRLIISCMSLALELAHRRFTQQARWTAQLRRHIFAQTGMPNASRVLEVGCGTGAVLETMQVSQHTTLFGLDIDLPSLSFAKDRLSNARLFRADAHHLPHPNAAFDVTFCHFVLLWLADPLRGLQEMRRVTRPGGAVIAFAEPDYSKRIDHPAELAQVGKWQTEALRAQGADPELGSRLSKLFQAAGFKDVISGELGAEVAHESSQTDQELELEVLLADLKDHVPERDLQRALEMEGAARQNSLRVVYVPTHYAWARP